MVELTWARALWGSVAAGRKRRNTPQQPERWRWSSTHRTDGAMPKMRKTLSPASGFREAEHERNTMGLLVDGAGHRLLCWAAVLGACGVRKVWLGSARRERSARSSGDTQRAPPAEQEGRVGRMNDACDAIGKSCGSAVARAVRAGQSWSRGCQGSLAVVESSCASTVRGW